MTQYLSLYRKFRPTTFDEVIGQNAIVSTLSNQIKTGEIGHAYLFTGTRGTGKTSCAKIFAKAVNCLNPQNGSPCGECENCKALSNANMDIIEIDAASNNSVEDIRDMRENIKFTPVIGKYKVYIIDEVHMLSINAFNALLKSIEEPPAHIIFILATTEVHKIPATILSRVQRLDFKLVGNIELEKHLKMVFEKSGIKAEEEAIAEIVKCGNGSVRDMLSTAECVSGFANKDIHYNDVLLALGKSDRQDIINVVDAILDADIENLFNIINEANNNGKNMSTLAKEIGGHFRDLLIIKSCKNANDLIKLPQYLFEEVEKQSRLVNSAILIDCLEKFNTLQTELRYAENAKMLLESVCLECLSKIMKMNLKLQNEEDDKKKQDKVAKGDINAQLDALQIWGQVIRKLRDKNEIILHTLCGGLGNVDVVDNELQIKIIETDKDLFNKINTKSNINILNNILKELGYNLNVNILSEERAKTQNEIRIEKLQRFFGEFLKVYED